MDEREWLELLKTAAPKRREESLSSDSVESVRRRLLMVTDHEVNVAAKAIVGRLLMNFGTREEPALDWKDEPVLSMEDGSTEAVARRALNGAWVHMATKYGLLALLDAYRAVEKACAVQGENEPCAACSIYLDVLTELMGKYRSLLGGSGAAND